MKMRSPRVKQIGPNLIMCTPNRRGRSPGMGEKALCGEGGREGGAPPDAKKGSNPQKQGARGDSPLEHLGGRAALSAPGVWTQLL